MRALILIAMAAAALVMGYIALQGECPGGKVYASEGECRTAGGGEACRSGFAEAKRKATLDYSPFTNENDCALQFPRCEPHGKLAGYVPVPRGVCIAPGKPGEPVYERFGQRVNPR